MPFGTGGEFVGGVTQPSTGGGGSGTVTSVSVVSANGLAGTVATSTTTPAISLSTTVTGIVKGNGTTLSAATAGTDYLTTATAAPSKVVTKSANYTANPGEIVLCTAGAGGFSVIVPIALSQQAIVKKVDNGAGTIAVIPVSGTIDGQASVGITTQYQSYTVVGDGTNGNFI